MEEHFKNKLKNHKVDWDKEELLGNIQKELSEKPSRSKWIWCTFIPLLFISTCWGVLQINSNNEKEVQTEDTTISNVNDHKIKTNDSSLEGLSQTESKIVNNKSIKPNLDPNQTKELNSALSKTENTKTENQNSSSSKFSFRNESKVGFSMNKGSNSLKRTLKNTTTTSPIISNSIIPNKENDHIIISIEQLPLLQMLSLIYEGEIPTNSILPKAEEYKPKQEEQTTQFSNYYISSSLGSIGFINRNMTSQSTNQGALEQLKLNEETVETRLLISSDLSFGYQHQSGWTLETGIGYNRVSEFFTFEDTLSYESIELEYENAYYFINQSSDTLFFSGPASAKKLELRKVRHNNSHSYFNIPLNFGYRYSLGKANLFSTAGVSYAFAHSFKGREAQIFQEHNKEVIDNPAYSFESRIGLHLGLGVDYPIFKRTHVFTKMAFQRSPRFSRNGVEQFYDAYSLGLGLRVMFE